jgi:hypothetical protein
MEEKLRLQKSRVCEEPKVRAETKGLEIPVARSVKKDIKAEDCYNSVTECWHSKPKATSI